MKGRHLVILNQEVNYLTTGLANSFSQVFESVTLVVGVRHQQGEALDERVKVVHINRIQERPSWRKAWSYLSAFLRMWWLLITRFRHHEVLFVSVPPMGYLLNLLVRHRFSMVIWDLYPDTFKVTGMSERHWLYRTWSWLNRLSFRKAYRVFTIGEILADELSRYVDRSKLIVHPIWAMNGNFQKVHRENNLFIRKYGLEGKFVVQYSGNIGVTHNVEILIDIAERLKDHTKIFFQIIGRGPRFPFIAELIKDRALPNVQLLPFQTEEMFPHSLSAADLGVVVLNEIISRGGVPSKAYNLMSFGIPALYLSSPSSQLALDAHKFGHARCYSTQQKEEIIRFILEISNDPEQYREMSLAATKAASNFTSKNAQLFVQSYMSTDQTTK